MKYLLLLFICALASVHMKAQNALTPGSLRLNTTFQHIAVHYDISGDDNLNSNMAISYRKTGSGDPFIPAGPTMRAEPTMMIDGSPLNMNFHAGSVFFLLPGVQYDVKITLEDPDGGGSIQTATVMTRSIPKADSTATQKYVEPGNGGGAGMYSDPYLGLQYAADQAQAGDIMNVRPGIYSSFHLNTNGASGQPIVFRATEIHTAEIDGANTTTGIITLGVYNDSLQHIIIDGFLIRNGRWGIDAQNTQFLTVRNNIIEDVDYGIVNRRANGWEHDQYIVNNSWIGNTPWPQTGGQIPGERGIDLRGNRNVVSFNAVSHFGDGISIDGPSYRVSYCMDIHNNDVTKIVDDAIEVDGSISNSAVYANRCFNSRMGVSLAPIFGGPCYVFRNIFYNLETSAYKMNRAPAGLIVCHNTSMKTGNGTSSDAGWQNTYFRNNIIMGDRYCFEEYDIVAGSLDDWNYDAYYSLRDGNSGEPWFKWDNIRYDNVAELNANSPIESHAIATSPNELEDALFPDHFTTAYSPMDFDFSPVSSSGLLNTGDNLFHLNAPFVSDSLPDIGAVELGMPAFVYGPDFDQYSSVKFTTTSNSISIYPNPANHFIVITGLLSDYQLRILDANGQVHQQIDNDGNYQVVDISHFGQGLYFIELIHMTNQSIYVKKILKYN